MASEAGYLASCFSFLFVWWHRRKWLVHLGHLGSTFLMLPGSLFPLLMSIWGRVVYKARPAAPTAPWLFLVWMLHMGCLLCVGSCPALGTAPDATVPQRYFGKSPLQKMPERSLNSCSLSDKIFLSVWFLICFKNHSAFLE